MKEILVTGGTGTLGREVVKNLLQTECKVTVLTTRKPTDLPGAAKKGWIEVA